MALKAYDLGFSHTGRVGACALSVLIHNNKLFAANSGDCKGVIVNGDKKKITCKKINNKFNANSKKE
jgi:serine/threonine protein phosphatase PrpC